MAAAETALRSAGLSCMNISRPAGSCTRSKSIHLDLLETQAEVANCSSLDVGEAVCLTRPTRSEATSSSRLARSAAGGRGQAGLAKLLVHGRLAGRQLRRREPWIPQGLADWSAGSAGRPQRSLRQGRPPIAMPRSTAAVPRNFWLARPSSHPARVMPIVLNRGPVGLVVGLDHVSPGHVPSRLDDYRHLVAADGLLPRDQLAVEFLRVGQADGGAAQFVDHAALAGTQGDMDRLDDGLVHAPANAGLRQRAGDLTLRRPEAGRQQEEQQHLEGHVHHRGQQRLHAGRQSWPSPPGLDRFVGLECEVLACVISPRPARPRCWPAKRPRRSPPPAPAEPGRTARAGRRGSR